MNNITWIDYGAEPYQGSDKAILFGIDADYIDADYIDDTSNIEGDS